MKKIRLALAAIALGGLMFSCSDDDDNDDYANAPGPLEGKWTPVRTITIANGTESSVDYNENEEDCEKDYREFTESGGYRYVVWYQNVNNQCTEDILSTTWARSGDVLTIVDSDPGPAESTPDTGTYSITKLTNSELHLESTATVGGVTVEVTKVYNRL